MARIQISNDPSGRIIVSFPYDPLLIEKVDPALKLQYPMPFIARDKVPKQSPHNFEELRRELVSRKYSYKTIKDDIYYN